MYKLPKNFTGNFFIGRTLEQIIFTINQIFLCFDDDISIIISSAFLYSRSGEECEVQYLPVKISNIMRVLELKIIKVESDHESNLLIIFENGDSVQCFNNLINLECYTIKNHDEEIVI